MEEEGTWATDVEMFALTHLLGVCLYVHIDDTGMWNKYSP